MLFIYSNLFEQTRKCFQLIQKYANIFLLGNVYFKLLGHCLIFNNVFKGLVKNCPLPEARHDKLYIQ